MGATTPQKKAVLFRLDIDLLARLKDLARREHRSLNNYVECLLLDAAYNEPNDETKAAIREAQSGALRDTPPIDVSRVDSMLKSMGI